MIVALNNKCNLNCEEFKKYIDEISKIKTTHHLIVIPSTINISSALQYQVDIGAQNVSSYENGAHTGEISAEQLSSYGIKYCIIGHSERRQNQKESNEEIHQKVAQLLKYNITPILCVGESKEERKNNLYKKVILQELSIALDSFPKEKQNEVIIAYEPIWSIGTGLIPTNEQIEEVNNLIKSKYNNKVLYGGSANNKNIAALKKCSSIDGYLLGGLSLKPIELQDFVNKL